MSGGAHLSRPATLVRGVTAALLGTALLAGCARSVDVDDEQLDTATAASCKRFVAALPDSIGPLERRDADGDFGAAYGDPPLVIRCGVPDIGASTADIEVAGIDWEPVEADGGVVLSTIGRCPTLQVLVPDHLRNDNAWLIDLSGATAAATSACDR